MTTIYSDDVYSWQHYTVDITVDVMPTFLSSSWIEPILTITGTPDHSYLGDHIITISYIDSALNDVDVVAFYTLSVSKNPPQQGAETITD